MTVKTGYFRGGGQLWDHGEVPDCDICGKPADKTGGSRATNTSGVNICYSDECAITHCDNTFTDIVFHDDGKAPCIDCEEPTLPVEHGWVIGEFICGGCISDYEELVIRERR